MKKRSLHLFVLLALTLVGCQTSDSSSSSSCNCSIPEEEQTPYEDIYGQLPTTRYAQQSAKDTHKASYGYTANEDQGYNGWSYLYKTSGSYSEMTYSSANQRFEQGDNFIQGPLMGSKEYAVARAFTVFPNGSGTVYVTGKAALASAVDSSAEIQILLNQTVVYPASGTTLTLAAGDTTGIYHEKMLNVIAGDVLYFVVSGQGKVVWNPTIQYDAIAESPLHYNPEGKFENGNNIDIGDVHPYYHDGKLYMYYLKTDGGYNTALVTSDNMLAYQDGHVTTHPVNPPNSNYYVLGITEEAGGFRTYYGASSSYIYGAKSNDLITWEAGEGVDELFNTTHLPSIHYPAGGRDPYVFYDTDIQRYRIVYLAYYANKYWTGGNDFDAALSLQTSVGNSTERWEEQETELLRFDNAGTSGRDEPEVAQILKIGRRWYIFASMYGRTSNGVGAPSYWTGDLDTKIDEVNWNQKQERFLDGEDLCASQIVKIGTRYYLYGWIASRAGGGGWGGAINVARELYAKSDGTLATRLDPYMTKLLNGGSMFSLARNETTAQQGTWDVTNDSASLTGGGVTMSGLNMSAYGELLLSGSYRRTLIESKLSMGTSGKIAGFKLQQKGAADYATVAVDQKNGQLIISGKEQGGYLTRAKYKVDIENYDDITLKLIVEGGIVEFYVNDTYALTARIFDDGSRSYLSDFSVSLFGDGSGTTFSDLSVNMLRSLETAYD